MANTSEIWAEADQPNFSRTQSFYSRIKELINFNNVQMAIRNPMAQGVNYQDMLNSKKLWEDSNTYVTSIERSRQAYEMMANGKNADDSVMETDEYKQVSQDLLLQSQLKMLSLYFDSYMSEQKSDMQWRLGNIRASVNDPEVTNPIDGLVDQGYFRTRSDMTSMYEWYYIRNGSQGRTQKFYSSMYFPPYKIGAGSDISEKDYDDSTISANDTYDLSVFQAHHDNYVYRDVGMKQLSDYIDFLQWVTEGCTGIVSTYLTEWDLSLYMQEGMMTPKINGGPMNIYLNYRIYEDNPLSDKDNQLYTGDEALAFNVCGSAVSKLFYDCTKQWRPSDYPRSIWWTPYELDTDFTLNKVELTSIGQTIPYMSIYDDVKGNYSYDSASLQDIIRHQDFIGYIASAKNRIDALHYYDAFYSTEDDGLSDMDVKLKSLLKQVQGADPGQATAFGKDIDAVISMGRKEMIMNGGWYGSAQTVSNPGGYLGRTAIEFGLSGVESQTSVTNAAVGSANANSEYLSQTSKTSVNEEASTSTKSFLDTSKDSSTMSDLTGINRFSPAIYGGPHGSSFSLNNLRGYFQSKSAMARNIVRAEPYIVDDSADIMDTTRYGIEADYKDSSNNAFDNAQSPIDVIRNIKEGTYSYETKLGYVLAQTTGMIEGDAELIKGREVCSFPSTYNGKAVIYVNKNDVSWTNKIIKVNRINKFVAKLKGVDGEDSVSNLPYSKKHFYTEINRDKKYIYYRKRVPTTKAKYYILQETTFKYYFINDMPTTSWKIFTHTFETYKATEKTLLNIKQIYEGKNIDLTYLNYLKENGPAYVLALNNAGDERWFMRNIIRYNRGLTDLPRYMWFFMTDSHGKVQYFFKAPCYIRYYKNSTRVYQKSFFGRKHYAGTQYTYMPFIYVDLNDTKHFYDLTAKVINLSSMSGEEVPIHISKYKTKPDGPNISNAIQAMNQLYSHTMTAYENKVTESMGLFLSIISFFKGWGGTSSYQNLGTGSIKWQSTVSLNASGKGILSGWPGIEPSCPDSVTVRYTQTATVFNHTVTTGTVTGSLTQKPYLKMPNCKDVKMSALPLFATVQTNDISPLQSQGTIDYKLEGPIMFQTYRKTGLPKSISDAINKASTLLQFYSYGQSTPNYYDISSPYINFLSFCATTKTYLVYCLKIFKTLSFESLRKLLLNNVDNCVLKACGLKKTTTYDENGNETGVVDELCAADKLHPLYDYWIDTAIQMLYNKAGHETYRQQIIAKFEQLISSVSSTIANCQKIMLKGSANFTYNDLKALNSEIYIQKQNFAGTNVIDKFMFAYLHILYCYRLFFIGRRFNKKDGTMWIMRALESVIDLTYENTEPAKDPSYLDNEQNDYGVVFYEIQNGLDLKRTAVIDEDHEPLDVDKIYKIYVKVEYGTKADFDAWLAYQEDPNANPEAREMIKLVINDDEVRYAFKPKDGLYAFRAKEFDDNYKKVLWNQTHKDKNPKKVVEYLDCIFPITWKPTKECTPIRFNVFGTVNASNLLEYSQDSLSAEDLLCLTEEGADFWTITLPANMWPETTLYKTGLYIVRSEKSQSKASSTLVAAIGPLANVMSPIGNYSTDVSAGIATEMLNSYGVSLNI